MYTPPSGTPKGVRYFEKSLVYIQTILETYRIVNRERVENTFSLRLVILFESRFLKKKEKNEYLERKSSRWSKLQDHVDYRATSTVVN